MKHNLGAHTSTMGGVAKAVELADSLGFSTMQIFTKNNSRWFQRALTEEEIAGYKARLKKTRITPVIAHDSYLINLCAPSNEMLDKSREAFIEELQRCELLGIEYLNFHPGSHGGCGEKEGLEKIVESLNIAHSKTEGYNVKSMIELTAGQGTSLGYSFEHIRAIIDGIEEKSRISVCIDTAHIYAAGYDLKDPSGYEGTIKEFDDIIGLKLLKCIHMNDSKTPLGSRVDRHAHIGEGFIGNEGFSNIMNDKRLAGIPMILETPKTKGQLEDLENIKRLKALVKKGNRE
ncbi:MAG: deoxyribonuclease IV [Clostridiales bacterium]